MPGRVLKCLKLSLKQSHSTFCNFTRQLSLAASAPHANMNITKKNKNRLIVDLPEVEKTSK